MVIRWELVEEIGYNFDLVWEFCVDCDINVVCYVFYVFLIVELKDLVLGEGWDMGLLILVEIKVGKVYFENVGMEWFFGEFY